MKLTRHELKNMMAESIMPKGDCLSEELLIAFNEGKTTEQECEYIIEHLKTCRKCTDLWKSYEIFMSETVKKVPEKYKKKTYEKITKLHPGIIMRFVNSPYLAYAAILLLTVSIVFIFYTQFLLKQTDSTLALQKQRLEDLKNNQATSQQQLAALQNDLQKKEKEFLQLQVPVAGVPLYDLFPEGVYKRDMTSQKMLTISIKEGKPVYLILNVTEPVKNACDVLFLDHVQNVIWQTNVPSVNEATLTLLVPPNMLSPGKYIIELRDASSAKVLTTYRFNCQYESHASGT